MYLVLQFITSFIASAAFGMLFNAPKRSLPLCGFTGMVGWIVYILLDIRLDSIFAVVAATLVVGIISQIGARTYKKPVIIYSVSGIIPLVPGGLAYNAMRYFVEKDYNTAIQHAAQAFLFSGSIAIGLVLSEVLNQAFHRKSGAK